MNSLFEVKANLPKKWQVAKAFDLAAPGYDTVDHFQRDVANRLIDRMKGTAAESKLLILGCGTGQEVVSLTEKLRPTEVWALDIAREMLRYTKAKPFARTLPNLHLLQGDIEALPFADQQFSCIFSSLAIQWCEKLSQVLSEASRCLMPGGHAYFSTLLDGSLGELKSAWREVDNEEHVNPFMTLEALTAVRDQSIAAQRIAGREVEIELSTEMIKLEYETLRTLVKELKQLGASTLEKRSQNSLGGKSGWRQLVAAYDKVRLPSGTLPVTYRVAYIVIRTRT